MIESSDDDDLDFEFDDVDEDRGDTAEEPLPPTTSPPVARRRRRPRMGQVVKKMGKGATATPTGLRPDKVLEHRAHVEMGQRLANAGKNKGEMKGYGIASGRTEPPPPAVP